MTDRFDSPYIRLDVLVRDGAIKLPGDLPLPKLQADVIGEISVPASSFATPQLGQLLSETRWVELLPTGKRVLVGVRSQGIPDHLGLLALQLGRKQVVGDRRSDRLWVEVILQEALLWPVGGGGRPHLRDCKCDVPALGRKAESLNQACYEISKLFEPQRRSNSSNVFLNTLYEIQQDYWASLDDLRQAVEGAWEQLLRFAVLLDAFGIPFDLLPADGKRLPDAYLSAEADAKRHERIRQVLLEAPDITIRAHHRYGNELNTVAQAGSQNDDPIRQNALAVARYLAGESPEQHRVPSDIVMATSELVYLTHEAAANRDLFREPWLRALLSYCMNVLAFVWQSQTARQARIESHGLSASLR